MTDTAQLRHLIQSAVTAVGVELWGVEYHAKGRRSLLRIYIDGPAGVSVQDCARASRQVSSVLDVADPIEGEYTLEVSSPGANRWLYSVEHYRQFVGSTVKLRLRFPYEGRRVYTGLLNGVEDDTILLVLDDEEYVLPFESIERGNIVAEAGRAESD